MWKDRRHVRGPADMGPALSVSVSWGQCSVSRATKSEMGCSSQGSETMCSGSWFRLLRSVSLGMPFKLKHRRRAWVRICLGRGSSMCKDPGLHENLERTAEDA